MQAKVGHHSADGATVGHPRQRTATAGNPPFPYSVVVRTLVASLILLLLSRGDALPPPVAGALTLWAWERPDDLRWLAGSGVGVALLERTIAIHGDHFDVALRRQPLRIAPDSPLTSVVRIETDHAPLDARLVGRVASEIVDAARMPRATAVQIDFDARRSERLFYAALLGEVRTRIAPPMRLSMTALASWCADDPWIEPGVVDEIVPMLFQMGPDRRRIVTRLRENRRWPVEACNAARGVSTGEPWSYLPPARLTYLWRTDAALAARRLDMLAPHATSRDTW